MRRHSSNKVVLGPPSLSLGSANPVHFLKCGRNRGVVLGAKGRLQVVHRAGSLTLVKAESLPYKHNPTVAALVLVHADALPSAPSLAGRLKEQDGDALTVRDVAAAGVVTRSAVYLALQRRRIQGTKQDKYWTFTPEQAAV